MWNSPEQYVPRWYVGHDFWLWLESQGRLADILRMDHRKPHVKVKARIPSL